MSDNRAYIQPVLKFLQDGRIFIHHGDVICFTGQIGSYRSANLASTEFDKGTVERSRCRQAADFHST